MKKMLLIQYGELTTKKDNRNLFIKVLYQNIQEKLKNYDIEIKKDFVRMFITSKKNDIDEIAKKLQEVFGIHRIVICEEVHNNVEEIIQKVLEIMKTKKCNTFKVDTKRSDKTFPYTSMEMNQILGGEILENFSNLHVDVHDPDFILKVEIRKDHSYVYSYELKGSGGYPVGVQGKGIVMLSGGIDSPVSAYLAMKRGIKIECLYFESPPHTSLQAKNKVRKLVQILTKYQSEIKLHIVNFTNIQEMIYTKMDSTYMITIMRRMMYRISEKIAKRNRALILINGESIGQVASQTLHSLRVINQVTTCPVIRPVCCMDKLEIIELSKKIGTYETSILPYEDCCTIFVPKHPVIHPDLRKAELLESQENYSSLLEDAVKESICEKITAVKSENIF